MISKDKISNEHIRGTMRVTGAFEMLARNVLRRDEIHNIDESVEDTQTRDREDRTTEN